MILQPDSKITPKGLAVMGKVTLPQSDLSTFFLLFSALSKPLRILFFTKDIFGWIT